jgi:uncharacterized repeat protein (TIGR01451 family)
MLQKILLLLLMLLLGWLIPPLQAQFKFYPTEQNFGQNHYIRGNHVWQTTVNGILLRDLEGNLLQHYTPQNSGLANTLCFNVLEEADGTLWVTHGQSGVSRLKNGVWTVWDSNNPNFNLIGYFTEIVQENTGTIFIAGVNLNDQSRRFDGNNWVNNPTPLFGSNLQQSTGNYDLQTDKLGNVYLLTNYGIARWNGNDWSTGEVAMNLAKMGFNQQNELFTMNVANELYRWSSNLIDKTYINSIFPATFNNRKLFFDQNSNLWISPYIFTNNTLIPIPKIVEDYLKDFKTDSLGNIWITNYRGIYRFDGSEWKSFYSGFVSDNSNYEIKTDTLHQVWAITTSIISRFNTKTKQYQNFDITNPSIGISNNFIHFTVSKNGELWASSRIIGNTSENLIHLTDSGIQIITDSSTNFGLPSGDIIALEADAQNNLWLASYNGNYNYGLTFFDGSNWTTYTKNNSPLPSNIVLNIKRGAGNDIWASTDSALVHKDGNNWTIYRAGVNGMPNARIDRISLAPDGSMWVVFPSTLAHLKDNVWTVFSNNSGGFNSTGSIRDVEVDNQNQVWVASQLIDLSAIIQKFDGYNWRTYQYFPDFNLVNPVADIALDADGNVWFWSSSAIFSTQYLEKWVSGKVYRDNNLNCTHDTLEAGIGTRIVIAENTETAEKEYALSNIDGNFLLNLDSATYKIYSSTTNSYWAACGPPTTVNFGQTATDSAQVSLGLTADFDCPRMTVSVAAATLRRCFDNTYYVQYCNNGTKKAENAAIDLSFDDDFLVQSSSLPATSQTASSLHFELGTVEVGACGGFSVVLKLQCDSAQINERRCVKALIFPDSFCNTLPQWSGAEIKVEGVCTGDSVRFTIKNTGSAPSQSLDYVIIDEHVISREGNFQLDPTDIKVESILADGSAFRLEAQQEPFYPVASFPSATVEGCGPNPTSAFGFQYPEDDASPFVDWECRQVTGSFDPNDKTGFPQGFDNEHFILPGTELEYMIRFQNTGNDTAFNIVVRDTLHPFLEPTSIQAGASSHPYLWNVNERGVLTFYFNDVLLPDSTTNLLGSQGFVRFRIAHKADIILGSVIPNKAAIFFDFNAPIITNETWHTVDTGFLEKNITTISIPEKPNEYNLLLQVSPNPVGAGEFIYFEKMKTGVHPFCLRNALGQGVFEVNIVENKVKLPQNLSAGTYFFEIKNIGKGKLVVK